VLILSLSLMLGVGVIAIEVVIVGVGWWWPFCSGGPSSYHHCHHWGPCHCHRGHISFECLTLGDARRGKAKPLRITLIDEDRKPDKGFSW